MTILFHYWSPDTPRYLYAKDQDAKGDAPLERLYEKSIDEPVVIQAKDILTSLELERTATAGLRIKDFFWDTSNMQAARRIHTGVILVGDAYLMGIDIIFCYTTTIFQAYIGPALPMASGLVGARTTILAITNFTGVVFTEKLGRRTSMLTAFSHRHHRHQRWVEDVDLAPRLQRHCCVIQTSNLAFYVIRIHPSLPAMSTSIFY